MNRLPPEEPTGPCPARPTLIAFQSGRLSGPIEDRLAGHVETCATCLSTIRELSHTPLDEFEAKLLRFCADRSDLLDTSHPAYIRLEAGALELLDHDTCSLGGEGAANTDLEVASVGKIGPYTILDVLGRGGMGIVFRAFHEGLKRPVALKTLHPAAHARPESLARFRVEGEAVARLDHPNIVRVYDSGESSGQQYLAMELVEGETLSLRLGRDTMGHKEITQLVRSLAAAVGYAHGQGVIHRDLKPSNVLITRGGTPKVVDFGLARVLDGPQLTASEAVMGTPSYMAPEQAAGRTGDINEQTDIYALGVILYEALTGAPPFVGESKLRVIQMVRTGDVAPPSQSNPEVSPELETICLRCLEPLQKDRYRKAHELVQELDRLLEGKPIQTRRPSRWRWVGRAARRRAPVALAVLLLAAGLVGATAALIPQQQAVSAVPNGESETVRRELEAELDKGRPVTLVGETGYPKWFRWRAGKGSQRTHIEPDGTFSAEMIENYAIGLLELLPDARTDRYKLTAQVRHDLGGQMGFVGLYVGHRTYPWQPSDIHCIHHTRFNAVTSSPVIIRPNVVPPGTPLVPVGQTPLMALVTHLRTDILPPPNIDSELNWAPGGGMVALGPRNGIWHDFEIDVSPDGIVATMAGRVMKIPAADLTPESLFKKAARIRDRHPDDPAIQNLRPEFTPKGGLGLVVYPNAAVSIRCVTVTPQPK